MMAFKRDKKEEEEGVGNPFVNVEKTAVLQEARQFNETPVNVRRCTHTLTKILYLINQGEQLGVKEATDAFFAMTKLFQSRDVILRRLVYLGIKELSNTAEDVIIVTSSLTKDMTGKEDMYRAAAIRALCSITDATMLQAIERYMKQAIVDKNPAVSSAALVSSLHMSKVAGDVVKRWVNEVQEASNADNIMVQYHALGVLYHIKKSDRLAVTKLMTKLTKVPMRSPYAVCMLIRIACKLLEDEESSSSDSSLFDFIESCLRHKSEMVTYEAAHAIANLRKVSPRELASAVCVLIQLCNNSKPTLRFAAVRTLNKVAMTHPSVVTASNMDLEALITDPNRSIATLAITTLLKTGSESSVDRLMKQISSFVNEISDEFKIVVVQAIRSLCLKFPRKHSVLMTFLSAMLRDEGGLDYKAAIADTIITVIEDNPEAKEMGLAHLCEFIEDCEHTSLAVRILHLLGKEGPLTKQPSRYIRFIYNRVILESAPVRAAAVAAMAQFGALCPDLRANILVLLDRCQMDTDDEVRDRATYYHSILSSDSPTLINHYIVDSLQVSITGLEKALVQHLQTLCDKPFDMSSVPLAAVSPTENKTKLSQDAMFTPPVAPVKVTVSREESYAEKLAAVEQLRTIPGQLLKSSAPVELTESETEYVVKCIKHTFPQHVVVQFDVVNTLNDQLLEQVRLDVDVPEGFNIVQEVPIAKLPYGETGHCYVVLEYPTELSLSVASFGATLKFVVKDCDPATGMPDTDDGYQDEYIVEDFEIGVADQMQKLAKTNFGLAWDEAVEMAELEETFDLANVKSLEEAINSIVNFLNMAVADKSDKVAEGKSTHSLFLSGVFRGGHQVLVRAKLVLSDHVTMQLTVRAPDPDIAELIISNVG